MDLKKGPWPALGLTHGEFPADPGSLVHSQGWAGEWVGIAELFSSGLWSFCSEYASIASFIMSLLSLSDAWKPVLFPGTREKGMYVSTCPLQLKTLPCPTQPWTPELARVWIQLLPPKPSNNY